MNLTTLPARFALLSSFVFLAVACSRGPKPKPPSHAALAAPSVGSAQSFAVLAGSTVTNTGPTTVAGNLGVDPGQAVTGFPPGLLMGGVIHAGDAVSLQAQSDVTKAYDVLAGAPCDLDLSGKDLGGLTLTPGVYCFSSSAQLTGALTLDAEGNRDAVFLFQIGTTLTTASNASVRVTNGGLECNVMWQVGSSATLGTTTAFIGDLLALASITVTTGARVSGRVLARNGAVTLDTNVLSAASCGPALDSGGGPVADLGSAPAVVDLGSAPALDLATSPPVSQDLAAAPLDLAAPCDDLERAPVPVPLVDLAPACDLVPSPVVECDGGLAEPGL